MPRSEPTQIMKFHDLSWLRPCRGTKILWVRGARNGRGGVRRSPPAPHPSPPQSENLGSSARPEPRNSSLIYRTAFAQTVAPGPSSPDLYHGQARMHSLCPWHPPFVNNRQYLVAVFSRYQLTSARSVSFCARGWCGRRPVRGRLRNVVLRDASGSPGSVPLRRRAPAVTSQPRAVPVRA